MFGFLDKLAKPFVARAYRGGPIDGWPAWAATLLELKTPNNVALKATESPEGGSNINIILALLDETRGLGGDIAECGVFKAASLSAIGLYLKQTRDPRRAHGFDSFQGFDNSVEKDVALGGAENSERRVGGFDGTSLPHVRGKLASLGVLDRVSLHPGYFAATLETEPERRYSFVHLDCDIYDSYMQTLSYFYPRLDKGGIVLFDEYDDPPWPGCNLAIDEFLADKPEKPIRISRDNYVKSYIRKS